MIKILLLAIFTLNTNASDYEINAMVFYPSHYINKETNKPDGIIINVINRALKEVNKTVSFNILPIKRCMHSISHENEMACATLPLGKNSQYPNFIFHKESIGIKQHNVFLLSLKQEAPSKFKLEDLKNKSVSLFESEDLFYITKLKDLKARPITVATDLIALKFLKNKQSDFAVVYEHTFNHLTIDEQLRYEKLFIFDITSAYVAFNPKHPKSKNAMADLDQGLKIIKEKGILKKMSEESLINLKIDNQ